MTEPIENAVLIWRPEFEHSDWRKNSIVQIVHKVTGHSRVAYIGDPRFWKPNACDKTMFVLDKNYDVTRIL
jgi:hypothetical protein